MDNQYGETPVYFDGSKHLMKETSNEKRPGGVRDSIPDPEEWRRFIGANPYEFNVR
jgi:hypothetical protein